MYLIQNFQILNVLNLNKFNNLLSIALLEPTEELVDSAVARRRAAHVELQEAGLVRRLRLVAP